MIKKVLAIYYTQTGQLNEIVDNFTAPFTRSGVLVEKVIVSPKKKYPFPWTSDNFFDEMPESVLSIPTELVPFTLREPSYDLIIFAYQPWFLSPSIPATSLLVHPAFQAVLKNTPVVTLIGARNMWLNAQVRVKKALGNSGANLVGNVALVDKNNNTISAVTILYWMLTGKKDRYLKVFPKPGVADADIARSYEFGEIVLQHLLSGDWGKLQSKLIQEKAVEVKSDLMFIESRAKILFSIWANLIIKKKNRRPWVFLFKYYLLIALFIVAPIVVFINKLTFQPFLRKRINQKKQYYLALN
ncbi:MAG: hypothetical protein ABIN89_08225 [Chitinophagaceae bacterium]